MTEDIMPTFRQKIKLNNEELMYFHKDVNSWRETLREDGKEESTLEDLCYVLSSDDESEDTADDLVMKGKDCIRKGEWSRAISFYSTSISRKALPRSYANRALAHLKRNNPTDAEEDCTQAISLNSEYKKAYLRRACARKLLGKCKESCDDLEVVLNLDPDNSIVLAEHDAMIKYIANNLLEKETAKNDVKTPTKTEIADKIKQQGNKLIGRGDYAGAKEKFTAAIQLNPSDPTFYANRAICQMKLMDFKGAEKDCNKALELDLNYIKVYIRRGRIRRKLGKMYEARQDFYNAYELSNEHAEVLEELEEVDQLIRKLEETRRRNGMAVKEVGVVSLMDSGNCGGDSEIPVTLNWNELRPSNERFKKSENEMQKVTLTQHKLPDSEASLTGDLTDKCETVLPKQNQNEKRSTTEISQRGGEYDRSKNGSSQHTKSITHNMTEVFPLKPNDPVARFSGPFIRVRVEDAKFAMPEKLLEIPDKFKI